MFPPVRRWHEYPESGAALSTTRSAAPRWPRQAIDLWSPGEIARWTKILGFDGEKRPQARAGRPSSAVMAALRRTRAVPADRCRTAAQGR
ncbi:hypothetical protein GGR33_003506 [Methylobacterium brachythecii]|uniref:Uncharacterized protein n=1 Tax=Methylobacterium brachythecii TaxID=1176177 RepID=A0A7W6AQH2_9HYPH|nr:hypothetical protein [Methylobacterium brachythecii]